MAKKFKYRLEGLLKVKEHIEKEKQRDHAKAMHQVIDQENKLGEIDNNRQESMKTHRSKLTGSITVSDLMVYTRYLNKLKRDTLTGREILIGLEKDAEKKRKVLVEASKERKIYEKLKEKQRDKYLKEMTLQEKKENDEIAANCHRQKKNT